MTALENIQNSIKTSKLDALLLISQENRLYATGFPASDGGCLITSERAYFFTDARYIEAAREGTAAGFTVGLCSRERPLTACIKEALEESGVRRLGAEEESLSFARYSRLSNALGLELLPAQNIMTELRESKSEAELEKLIAAQRIAETALCEVLPLIRPGLAERELAAEIEYRMRRHGAERASFETIAISGANTSRPHGVPGEKLIEKGEFVTMDFGCVKYGYCSDMTRTVAVGGVTEEMKNVYSTVLAAQMAGIAAARPGVTGASVHAAAAEVIEAAGYGEYFTHGFGHGVGIEIHEAPAASPANTKPLPEGAVISAEPGIYLEGRFGVRIEDVLYLTGNGCVNITKAPKDLMIL